MFFVDPETHAVVAHQADPEGKLQANNGVFAGKLPPEMGVANTAVKWVDGVRPGRSLRRSVACPSADGQG
jgi:hypothetical protein